MNTKQLKSKILDLAIHGKLVPQNPNDESASKLLEKIREEKQKLIAEKKIKADKNDSYIFVGDDKRHYEKFADGTVKDIEDEIPFDVPEGWAWARIASLVSINLGLTHTPKYVEKGIPFYSVKDISNGYLDESEPKYVSQEEFNTFLEGAKPRKGDIIFCRVGTIGKPHIVSVDYPFGIFVSVGFFRKYSERINSKYIMDWMNSPFFYEQVDYNVKGGVIKNLNTGWLSEFLIPIPSEKEQQEIAFRIDEIFSKIALLEENKTELQKTVTYAKAKILDLAIHGKLVPQDTNDEPASVLLEKLRAEKEEKIAKGELKRDKNDSFIYKGSDNCYYEKFADGTEEQVEPPAIVPESWVWCHFGDVADVINGKNQSKVEDESGIYPIYGSGGIMGRANDYICPENCTIIGRKGSINNPIFVEEKFWNVDTAFGLAPSTGVLPKYLFYFCKSFNFTSLDSSTTLPSLTKTNIQQILFPLPSLSEQQRILNKVESLFKKLDEIVLNLI